MFPTATRNPAPSSAPQDQGVVLPPVPATPPPEAEPVQVRLGYCGICRDWYEVIIGTGDRCPLCGYRAGDM